MSNHNNHWSYNKVNKVDGQICKLLEIEKFWIPRVIPQNGV